MYQRKRIGEINANLCNRLKNVIVKDATLNEVGVLAMVVPAMSNEEVGECQYLFSGYLS